MTVEIAGNPVPIRPPWALPEERFREKCTQCAECVKICPEQILLQGADGYPQVSFNSRGCTFCGKCVVACDDNALHRKRGAPAWSLALAFSDLCLTAQGIACRVCIDVCAARALSLPSAAPAPPAVNAALCTGCGSCVNPCPVQAIAISRAY